MKILHTDSFLNSDDHHRGSSSGDPLALDCPETTTPQKSSRSQHKPHLSLAKDYWRAHLTPDDFAIDATCGNGHDTFFLTQLLPQGIVFTLDIQEQALLKAKQLLGPAPNVRYFCQSHAHLELLPLPAAPRLIVYNLGYLPGGDKSITTMTETTLQSIRQSLSILSPNGAISITCYPGHDEGSREETALLEFVKTLPHEISFHEWDHPRSPSFLWILSNKI